MLLLVFSAAFRPTARLTGRDTLALPAFKVALEARIEHDGPVFLNPEVGEIRVRFSLGASSLDFYPSPSSSSSGGQVLGEATTDATGRVQLAVQAPARPGNYPVTLEVLDPEKLVVPALSGMLILSVTPHDAPLVITDIDDTIGAVAPVETAGGPSTETVPLPGAQETLVEVSSRARVVYLTARPLTLAHETREWLALHRFPAGPVYHRDLRSGPEEALRGAWLYKSDVIENGILGGSWQNLRFGVGHREGDQYAYRKHKIPSLLIAPESAEVASGVRDARAVESWDEARKILLEDLPERLVPEKTEARSEP